MAYFESSENCKRSEMILLEYEDLEDKYQLTLIKEADCK